jgi:hypothetical protein
MKVQGRGSWNLLYVRELVVYPGQDSERALLPPGLPVRKGGAGGAELA